jgi:hypothetical protein
VLAGFLKVHRDAIIARAGTRVGSRAGPRRTDFEMANGVPVFLEQVGEALRLSKSSEIVDHEQIDRSAARHGRELHRMGLTLAQVVHEYGDVCQVVSELAIEHAAPISAKDFGTLSLCLDDAIASAVTAYSHASERAITDQGSERTGASLARCAVYSPRGRSRLRA